MTPPLIAEYFNDPGQDAVPHESLKEADPMRYFDWIGKGEPRPRRWFTLAYILAAIDKNVAVYIESEPPAEL